MDLDRTVWTATNELRVARYVDSRGAKKLAIQQKFVSEWAPFEVWRALPTVDVGNLADLHPGQHGDE